MFFAHFSLIYRVDCRLTIGRGGEKASELTSYSSGSRAGINLGAAFAQRGV